MAFVKNWAMAEKECLFHFESYAREMLRGFTETSFTTALSARYLNYFVILPRD